MAWIDASKAEAIYLQSSKSWLISKSGFPKTHWEKYSSVLRLLVEIGTNTLGGSYVGACRHCGSQMGQPRGRQAHSGGGWPRRREGLRQREIKHISWYWIFASSFLTSSFLTLSQLLYPLHISLSFQCQCKKITTTLEWSTVRVVSKVLMFWSILFNEFKEMYELWPYLRPQCHFCCH